MLNLENCVDELMKNVQRLRRCCVKTTLLDFGTNRPFSSSKNSHFQNESKCKTFLGEMSFTCTKIENHISHLARRFETEA